jgi:DNA-binding FrmR family transcriptional regulator
MTDEVVNRLKSIEGQLKGISRLVENEANLFEIVGQIKAVQAALSQIKLHLLDRHLHTCLINVVQHHPGEEQEQTYKQLIELFEVREKQFK